LRSGTQALRCRCIIYRVLCQHVNATMDSVRMHPLVGYRRMQPASVSCVFSLLSS